VKFAWNGVKCSNITKNTTRITSLWVLFWWCLMLIIQICCVSLCRNMNFHAGIFPIVTWMDQYLITSHCSQNSNSCKYWIMKIINHGI
jgi:hypothetical protein